VAEDWNDTAWQQAWWSSWHPERGTGACNLELRTPYVRGSLAPASLLPARNNCICERDLCGPGGQGDQGRVRLCWTGLEGDPM